MSLLNVRDEYARSIDKSNPKLYHPELVNMLPMFTGESPTKEMYNTNLSNEEKRQIRTDYMEGFLKYLPPVSEEIKEKYVTENVLISGCCEEPDAPLVKAELCTLRKVKERSRKHPAIIYAAGGALLMAFPNPDEIRNLAEKCKATVVTPIYRASIDGEYPAAINDLQATYEWIINHAEELNVDTDKILIVGNSSGGTLACALAFRLKRYGYKPRGVVVYDPIVEDRPLYPSQRYTGTQWNGVTNNASAHMYLGKNAGSPLLGPEAFANRATIEECVGLCPVFIHATEHDIDSDPSSEFAAKLRQAGTYSELHVWGGTNHGFLCMSDSDYAKRFRDIFYGNCIDCLQYDLRR